MQDLCYLYLPNCLFMPFDQYTDTVVDRFLRYVQIDTQSDMHATAFPSTEKQKDLARLLVKELQEMGLQDAHLDVHGYVYATLPSNTHKKVPVICFCSHMDTSPDCSGSGVKPLLHRNYNGGNIILPDDPTQILNTDNHPELAHQLGNDIITASGTTLLGADNKAGLAEIMEALHFLIHHPEIRHGAIKVLFTPDEEIGHGVDHVDLQKLGADYGYTVDGETVGSLEDETFNADGVQVVIHGVSVHTGFAKGKMVSALKIACELVARLPRQRLSPETTEGREGFIHPVHLEGTVEKATIDFLIRDFALAGLHAHTSFLQQLLREVVEQYPGASATFHVKEQYRNMKEVLDQHPQIVTHALEAMRRAGLTPVCRSIRGGTDGARLSFMGLPCPNIFAGEHAFHSKQEWVSVQDMQKAVQTIVHLVQIWEEQS